MRKQISQTNIDDDVINGMTVESESNTNSLVGLVGFHIEL